MQRTVNFKNRFFLTVGGGQRNFIDQVGVRYEVALALRKSAIVHINGPFVCSAHPDANIFSYNLKHKLHIYCPRTNVYRQRLQGPRGRLHIY
jgi:hypothetical protein